MGRGSLEHVHAAAASAEQVVSELFEARIAADFYTTAKVKDEYARRFVSHLYQLEIAGNALNESLSEAGPVFRAVASNDHPPSIHDRLNRMAFEVCITIIDAILCAAVPDKWPPTTHGEYDVPSQLPCESDFLHYAGDAITAFTKDGPTHDELNKLSDLREQELARATVQLPDRRQSLAGANSDDPPIIVSLDPPQITIDGTAYALAATAATLLDAIVQAKGEWVNGHSVVNQPSRVVAAMPKQVQRWVESAPGKGFRLQRERVI